MSTEENKAIVRRLHEEYLQKRNPAVPDELFAADYVLRMGFKGWITTPTHGPEVYKSIMKAWWEALPDLTTSIEQMIAEGDKVVTIFTWAGTHQGDLVGGGPGWSTIRATGKPLILPDIIVSRISEGQIAEEWESSNHGSIWQQLGAIPSAKEATD